MNWMSVDSITGLVVTIMLGIVSIWVTRELYRRSSEEQNKLRTFISAITGLFAASQKVGIDTAYQNREVALSPDGSKGGTPFVSRFNSEHKLIVVGSSLLGFRLYVQHLDSILLSRQQRSLETKFLLTHPCFSSLRENQEGRGTGQIKTEIEQTIRFLENSGLARGSLRFYRGTPTCFMVVTSEAMLVNPYPYQIEAFKSFCLEVRRLPQESLAAPTPSRAQVSIPPQVDKDRFAEEFRTLINSPEERQFDYSMDVGPDIYGQFYWYHYLLPWFSREAVTFGEFTDVCQSCDCLTNGYSKTQCRLPAQRLTPAPPNGPVTTTT
jgi:hypothetical protein